MRQISEASLIRAAQCFPGGLWPPAAATCQAVPQAASPCPPSTATRLHQQHRRSQHAVVVGGRDGKGSEVEQGGAVPVVGQQRAQVAARHILQARKAGAEQVWEERHRL